MKSRILLILHLPPPVHGAAMVGKFIHDSKTINDQFMCRYINLSTASSLEDIGKVSLGKFKIFVGLLRNIRFQVKAFHPDIVYVTPNAKGGAFYKDFLVVQQLKRMGCKVVAHYHNKGVSTRQNRWVDNLLYRRFFKGIKVILLGKSLYGDVEKYVRWEDVYFCPNGIPENVRYKKEDVKVENKVTRLLFLSNLIESKGIFVLLDALKILKDKGYSYICYFVGGETKEIDAARFDREVELRGLNEIAIYKGRKYGEEKERVFGDADIFVFPTYYDNECFPLVLLEAMQHRLPIVTTNEGAINDIVEDGVNGFLVDRRDPFSLADKIEVLLNDKAKRQKMGDDGARMFNNRFSLDIFEKRMCEVLKQLI